MPARGRATSPRTRQANHQEEMRCSEHKMGLAACRPVRNIPQQMPRSGAVAQTKVPRKIRCQKVSLPDEHSKCAFPETFHMKKELREKSSADAGPTKARRGERLAFAAKNDLSGSPRVQAA